MERRAHYTLVGLTVCLVIALFCSFLYWVSRRGDDHDYNFYQIMFRKFSLSGLQVNSYVTMRGIPVGSVLSLRVSQDDIEEIKVVIKVHHTTPIKVDTRAVIERNLLTGLATVDLIGSSKESAYLMSDGKHAMLEIPEGRAPPLAALQEGIPSLIERLNRAADGLIKISSDENIASLSAALMNIEKLSANLVITSEKLPKLLEQADLTLKNISNTSNTISDESKKSLESFRNELRAVSRSLSDASRAIENVAINYSQPKKIIDKIGGGQLGPGENDF
jgi:phospholipid/cholesterol/gamma-HCH transport system substrate-binding protein